MDGEDSIDAIGFCSPCWQHCDIYPANQCAPHHSGSLMLRPISSVQKTACILIRATAAAAGRTLISALSNSIQMRLADVWSFFPNLMTTNHANMKKLEINEKFIQVGGLFSHISMIPNLFFVRLPAFISGGDRNFMDVS